MFETKVSNDNKTGQDTDIVNLFCDPCKNDGQTHPVEGFCVDCEEYLCEDCYKVHCRPSITRHHVLQGKRDMPKKRLLKPDTCTIHTDQTIEFYCENHEEVCCSDCRASSHEKCDDIRNINETLPEIDLKKEFEKLQSKTMNLKEDINRTQYIVQASHKAISVNHDKAKNEMNSLRKRVKEHIDEIESQLDKKMKTIRDEDERKIITQKNTCEAMHFDTNTLKSYVQSKMSTNRKHEAFIAMKRAQSKIKINHVNLEKIRMESKVKRYTFQPDDEVCKLTGQPCSFGKLPFNEKETNSTQFITDLNVRHANDSKKCKITGLCLISESLIAAADNVNKKVKIIDTKLNKITANISLSSSPRDLTMIPDNKLIVTLPEEKMIQFFSVALPGADMINLEKSVSVSGTCSGIDFILSDRKLAITYTSPGEVEILNLDGILERKIDVKFSNPTKISVIPNTSRACISESRDSYYGKLMLVDIEDQKKKAIEIDQFSFNNRFPYLHGIAVDKHGISTYLCSDNKVYVISTSGLYQEDTNDASLHSKMNKEIVLGNTYGEVEYARSIAFCDRTFRLYIGGKSDKIKVYIVA